MHELKELVFISLYLYVSLGAVILMKTAVLHTQGIEFTPWGIAVVKAVVLAKFMLLGEAMKIGGSTTTGPLIGPTLFVGGRCVLRSCRPTRRPLTVEDVMAVAKDRGGMALDRFVPSWPYRMPT
jgi:hypothetical protein